MERKTMAYIGQIGWMLGGFSVVIGFFFALLLQLSPPYDAVATDADVPSVMIDAQRPRVVLDAGHGGEDGGAVSATGVSEKTLNLSVALKLGDMLRAAGVDVIYTRTDDQGLYDGAIPGHRKMADLKNRLAVWSSNEDAILVSVHMNTFSSPQYSGMQVFYSAHDPYSKQLAELVRETNRAYLQPANERATKVADASIYLLDRCPGVAILAECGFLSNPEEAALLSDAAYREKVAGVLCAAILTYFDQRGYTT